MQHEPSSLLPRTCGFFLIVLLQEVSCLRLEVVVCSIHFVMTIFVVQHYPSFQTVSRSGEDMGERGAMLKATRIYLEQQNERPK